MKKLFLMMIIVLIGCTENPNILTQDVQTGNITRFLARISSGQGLERVIYGGEVLPEDATPSWTSLGGQQASVSNGMLSLIDTLDSGGNAYIEYKIGDTGSNSVGNTFEAKIKVNSINKNGASYPIMLLIDDGTKREILSFDDSSTIRLASSGETDSLDVTEFHVYRLTMKGNDSKVYVDGQLVLENSSPLQSASGTANSFFFGADGNLSKSNSEWDYVLYNNQGAFVP